MTAAQVDEALRLVNEAAVLLRNGRVAEARHRLLDAAGIAYEASAATDHGRVVGIDVPTGRGFSLEITTLHEIGEDPDVSAFEDDDEGTTT